MTPLQALSQEGGGGGGLIQLQIFMRMGLPKIITTENDTEFKNELNKQLVDIYSC